MKIIQLSLFFTFVLKICLAKVTVNVHNNRLQNNIVKCAVEIANKNFNLRKATVVLSKDVDMDISVNFLKSYRGVVVLETKKDVSPGQVLVIVDTYNSFLSILGKLKPDLKGNTLLNSGAMFLIVLVNYPHHIDRITKILWSYRSTNAIIVASDNNKDVKMFTYFPFKNHLNCQNTEPTVIGVYKENSLHNNLYSDKMGNMKGCPLYISTSKLYHQATEQKVPLEIMKKTMTRLLRDVMNFTPIVSARDYISIDSDRAKNWSDSLNDVVSGQANVSTCNIPLGVDRTGLLDYSFPYFRVSLSWIAPPVTAGPVWWRLLSPLNGYLWLNLLFILCVVSALPFALNMSPVKAFCYRHFKNIDKVRGITIRIWGVMFGQPIRVSPTRFRDFYIISLWIWFTFFVRSAYQSVLISALKTDTVLGDFVDLQDAFDSGYKFGGRSGVFVHFEHDPLIADNFVMVPEDKFERTFHAVIEGRTNFVIATSVEYAWAYCLSQGMKENECGHALPDVIMTAPLVIWMRPHSPFSKPISLWLLRLFESGMLDKDAIKKPPCCAIKSTDPSPLTTHQILSCVLLLGIGYAVAVAVFALEILTHKTKGLKDYIVEKTKEMRKRKRVPFTL